MQIRIIADEIELLADLVENETAAAISASSPLEATASRWGQELYFDCPVDASAGERKQTMDVGDIGYWIEGGALAIFFGQTPASIDERPRAAVPVVFVGKVIGDAAMLDRVADGDIIRMETLA